MMRWMLLLVCLGCLAGCTTSPAPPTLLDVERVDNRKQFPVGLRELLRRSRHATLDELESLIGSPPENDTFVEVRGPFETPDGFWIESVHYVVGRKTNDIALIVNSGYLGKCFSMDEIAALAGAQEAISLHTNRHTYTLGTEHLSISFSSAHETDACLGSIIFSRRGPQCSAAATKEKSEQIHPWMCSEIASP